MASKKSFKVFWRIFLPLTLLLWVIIGLLGWYNISNEVELRSSFIEIQLKNVNATIIDAYEHGADIQETLNFINDYNGNTTLNDLRISVYNSRSEPIAHIGPLISFKDSDRSIIPAASSPGGRPGTVSQQPVETLFNIMTSNDGSIRTVTTAPYNANIARALSYNSMIWIVVIALAVLATSLIWIFARKVSESVTTLHDFARHAAEGDNLDLDNVHFSHDEIGDVTREIIRLYLDKDRANKRMEHEHLVAMRANEEKARIKRQTANNLNHEIKTPVGIIKGYIDTINADPDMPEPLKRSFLKKAQEHTDRLTQLLKDVSSITRLEDGSAQVEITAFDFHDLIYNIANDLDISDIAGQMTFDWHIPFDTLVLGNYTLLNNAIMNMVRNAAKYSKGTIIKLEIINEDNKTYTFSFADDGRGVGEEHIPHLFDRFYRVDEGRARKSGGTGLGLPIVKSTFRALGADITVRNARPHGLEFIFTLPKAKNDRHL